MARANLYRQKTAGQYRVDLGLTDLQRRRGARKAGAGELKGRFSRLPNQLSIECETSEAAHQLLNQRRSDVVWMSESSEYFGRTKLRGQNVDVGVLLATENEGGQHCSPAHLFFTELGAVLVLRGHDEQVVDLDRIRFRPRSKLRDYDEDEPN